ncbi:MAG: hypothetical protein WDN04_13980 [Rhodospirillales bacterium]
MNLERLAIAARSKTPADLQSKLALLLDWLGETATPSVLRLLRSAIADLEAAPETIVVH